MALSKNINLIVYKLEANSFIELQKLMLLNNVVNNTMFDYFQVQETENKAIVYFRADASIYRPPKEGK
jgi:hypothetical protein